MADNGWQKIRDVFDSAMRRAPAERREFVAAACAGNAALLAEVESLLSSLDSADQFLEAPAVANVADAFAPGVARLEKGDTIGHYKIIDELGSGGMGEVYLARDQRLDRRVAIKVLNETFSGDESNLQRFVREAKAASALNHPNILVIHEIGETDGAHYIVSEYVEGETLRTIFRNRTFELTEVLDLCIQIAGALATAHKARLIHRDIKPDNIMVRPDGYVKILDFGLAKLLGQENRSFLGMEEPTIQQNQTAKGVIMGTVNYMSPEQAKGDATDERTDIFSFGVVIYEMIAGRTPFAGESVYETFANLINAEPLPLSRFSPTVPHELQRIVSKLLEKNKDERFQTMKGLLTDLKDFRNNITSGEQIERTISPEHEKHTVALQATTAEGKLQTDAHVVSRRTNLGKMIAMTAAVLLIAVFAVSYYVFNAKRALTFKAGEAKRLTLSGKVRTTAISPDGKFAIYAQKENDDQQSIWMQHVGTEDGVQLVPPAKIEYRGLDISPDGNAIYYTDGQRFLFQMGVLGGRPRNIAENVGWPTGGNGIAISPDGQRIAFLRKTATATAIIVANSDGSNEGTLIAFEEPMRASRLIKWSPDGKIIACLTQNPQLRNISAVQVADGKSAPILRGDGWPHIHDFAWMSDSQGLVVAGAPDNHTLGAAQLWQVSYGSGQAQQVTSDIVDYRSLALTADSKFLAALKTEQIALIWNATDSGLGQLQQLTAGFEKLDGANFIAWLPDNRIVFESSASSKLSIWVTEANGAEPQRLVNNSEARALSPDGRYLIYSKTGEPGKWRMDLQSGGEKQISSVGLVWPTISPDGRWLVGTKTAERATLVKMPVEGGEIVQILGEPAYSPAFSPDGGTIAFTGPAAGGGIALVSFYTGQIIAKFDARPDRPEASAKPNLQWTLDGRGIYFTALKNGASNIWRQPVGGGPPVQITKFDTGRIFNFAYSRDGKQLALSRGTLNSDVVLIKNSE